MRGICKKPNCALCFFEHEVLIPAFRWIIVGIVLIAFWKLVN